MLYRNIFPLTRNWENISKAITFLCQNVQNAKDLKKLGTLDIHIIRKKMKISVPYFMRKFEEGGGLFPL